MIRFITGLIQRFKRMSTALDALDVALANLTTAANNAALKLGDLNSNSIPAEEVQKRADAVANVATALQTAVDNVTPKA
jgi:hypothetical protein